MLQQSNVENYRHQCCEWKFSNDCETRTFFCPFECATCNRIFGLKSARFASKKKKQKDCYACVRKPFRRTHFINAISNIHCTGLMYAVAFARAIYQCIYNKLSKTTSKLGEVALFFPHSSSPLRPWNIIHAIRLYMCILYFAQIKPKKN